jgi:uncharacterized protein YecT (DUF1311 family)
LGAQGKPRKQDRSRAGLKQGEIVVGEVQRGRLVSGSNGRALRGGLATAALSLAAAGLLAGCQGAGTSAGAGASPGGSTPPGATVTASAARATGAASASAGSVAGGGTFAAIIEPFDPGHPARVTKAPADCGSPDTTVAIEQCYEGKTETADAAIDTLRQSAFDRASAAQQGVINAEDRAWLSARGPVCAKVETSGGTIDGINAAACLLDESTARLRALRGDTGPEAVLKSTDSTSLGDLSWYTTPAGSRIAMSDTQGDATGGAVIAWVIIAGADGYTVNPADFSYRDGSFTDPGTLQGASPRGHHVAPGTEYQFTVDYGHLAADPGKGAGGWVYAPGAPAATWR